jgi:hypothetical protein
MDEFQIEVLKANGYAYVNGGIVDAEGKYLPSVNLNNKAFNSESSIDIWNKGQQLIEKHANKTDPLDNIKAFEASPLTSTLSEEDKSFYPLYSEKQVENDSPTYDNVDIFQREQEKKASEDAANPYIDTLRNLQEAGYDNITDEYIDETKKNESLIAKIEKEDPSLITQRRNSDLMVETRKGIEEQAWYNPLKYANMLGEAVGEGLVLPAIETLLGIDYGMKGSDKDKKEYKNALQKRKELNLPALTILDNIHAEKEKQLKSAWEDMSFIEKYNPFDRENRLVEYGLGEIEAERQRIKDYANGSYIYNPINKDFMGDFATLGIGDAYDQYFYNSYLQNKINAGEALTPKEQMVAEALGGISESKSMEMDQTGLYNLISGTLESAKFLFGGAPGRLLLKGTTKAVTRGMTKALMGAGASFNKAKMFGKVGGESVNMLGQAVLHPDAHVKALNKYYGNITFGLNEDGEREVTTDRRTYKTLMDEIEVNVNKLEDELSRESDPEKSAMLRSKLDQIEEYKNTIKAPEGVFNSAIYGFTEVLKENAVEQYGGRLAMKAINNRYTRQLAAKPWVTKVANSAAVKNLQAVNNLFGGVKQKFNTLTGNHGSKLVGNNLEEMMEEVATQLIPVWGETDEEATMRRGELLEGDFYAQVAGQTLLMGGLMKVAYSPLSAYNSIQNSINLKDQRKGFKDMMAEFKKEGVSDAKIEEMLMATGEGNFTVQEFNNKIEDLRARGMNQEANDLERNKTYNIGKSLVGMGRGKQFVREMSSAIASGSIPPESIASVQEAIQEVKVLEADMKEHGDLRNREYVLQLKSKLRYTQKQVTDLEREQSKLDGEPQSAERDQKMEVIKGAITNIKAHEGKIEKVIATETSPQMKQQLEEESEVSNSMVKTFKDLLKANSGTMTPNMREIALREAKQKYGKTVNNKTYYSASKNMDRYILRQTINEAAEAQKKASEFKVEETPEVVVPPTPAQAHVEAVGKNINSVTQTLLDRDAENVVETPEVVTTPETVTTPVVGAEPITETDGTVEADAITEADNLSDPTSQGQQIQENDGYEDLGDPENDVPQQEFENDTDVFDDMPVGKDGQFEDGPFNALVGIVRDRVAEMEKEDGEKPSFEDYIEDMIQNGGAPIENFRGHLRALALAWNLGGLGVAKWKKIHNELFNDSKAAANRLAGRVTSESKVEPVLTENTIKETEKVVNKKIASDPITYEPSSGVPVHVTPNKNKTYGTEHKLNYSAIEFSDEVIIDENGKKTYIRTNDPIPKLNEKSTVQFKDLVNPNKNNIGDKLFPSMMEGEALATTSVPVRDKYGRQIKNISFAEWVDINKPEGQTLEEFQQTKQYRDKVPMVYKDSQGIAVAFVPEVEWFSVTSVGDRNKEVDENDLDNPSESLKKDIQENRDQTSALREEIINGTIQEVEIVDNLALPPLQIISKTDSEGNTIPTKSLNEVAPDTTVVWMKGNGKLYDLSDNAVEIKNEDILNMGDVYEGFLKREKVEIGKDLFDMQPINRNRSHYLEHVSTVNGVKKYIILNVQRKDEHGNNEANKEDVETARIITAVNNILQFDQTPTGRNSELKKAGHPHNMTFEQAQDIQRQIKELTGVDIKHNYTDFLEALIAYQNPDVDGKPGAKETFGSKTKNNLLKFNKDSNSFSSPNSDFRQNTKLGLKSLANKPIPSIKKEGSSYSVGKVKITPKMVNGKEVNTAETYADYLKERLSTNVMGYNVGTKEKPVFTIAVQQKIKLRPISTKVETVETKIEEQKKTPEVAKKVAEVETAQTVETVNEGKSNFLDLDNIVFNIGEYTKSNIKGEFFETIEQVLASARLYQARQHSEVSDKTVEREGEFYIGEVKESDFLDAEKKIKETTDPVEIQKIVDSIPFSDSQKEVWDKYKSQIEKIVGEEFSSESTVETEDLSTKKKFVSTKKRQEKEGGEFKQISISDINVEKSFSGTENIFDGTEIITVLEQRGFNQEGIAVGTVRIKEADGTDQTYEVFFNETNGKPSIELTQEQKDKRRQAIENAAALAKEFNLDIRPINESDDMIVAEMNTTKNVEDSIVITEGLTIKQEEDVVKWLFAKLANKDARPEEVVADLKKDLNDRATRIANSIADLQEFESNEVVENMLITLNSALDQTNQVLDNTNALMEEASLRAVNTSFITDEFEEDSSESNEKDFSKSSNETKPIDKVGVALKRIFAQVKDGNTGFMGMDTYTSFKQMYDTVTLALSSDTSLSPNFNEMISLLKKRKDSTPWMKPLIEELEKSDEQVKNQFVYNTYKQKVYAKFATLAFDQNQGVNSNIYDSNSNEAKRAVIDKWKENFKRSPINNEGKINTDQLTLAVEQWNSWFDSGLANQTNAVYQEWLGKFGINLSDSTMEALRNGELNVSESGGKLKKASFSDLFDGLTASNSKNRTGMLFTNLMKYSMMNKDKENMEFYENTKNHPFEDMNTILGQLAELETQYNPSYGSTSRYVAGKSVTEIEAFTYFYEQFKKLKNSALSEDKTYLQDMQNLSFSQDSFLLKMLLEDEVFANQFGHGIADLMALKELYKKSPLKGGIDDLSSIDYMFTQRAMFQNRNQGAEREVQGTPFKMRMAHMNTLTNSDKGRMMLLKTGVFDFFKQSEEAFIIDDAGSVDFTSDLKNLLFSQLVAPELRRMINFITKVKKTNIKDYDKGAARFNLIPELNSITGYEGETIQDFILRHEGKTVDEIMGFVQVSFGDSMMGILQDNIVKEATDNVKDLAQFNKPKRGTIKEGAVNTVDGFNNAQYLGQRTGNVESNMKVAELDFILNSMITNMNYMQLMAGDPALYYKSDIDVTSKDAKDQTKISQKLAINLGKRMAAMVAPGSVLADSNTNSYLQIFLDDVNGIADNMLDIIEWHYGKEALTEEIDGQTYTELVQILKDRKADLKIIRNAQDALEKRFSRIAEFIDIESTDAQEYTTVKEHIYVMLKQGRLSKEKHDLIQSNIEKGIDLTKEDLDLVLQPIKPVYTGTLYDLEQDVNRMMYIKSSSFPLIPQLTKGRKLDALRERMEEVEKIYNTTVRASYQSANKVGALTGENTVKNFGDPIMPNNMIELQREHFKIQQDVPFKSSKIQDDTVSMGTQIFKLLMGDGIMDMEGFDFEGEIISGKELQEKFHTIFASMVGNKKDKFLSSLGMDSNMKSTDPTQTMKKLQKLLIKEAKSRGFSKQDLKILSLVDNGKGEQTFKLPLWLTGNSNKYESMLNALINNKIFKQKIPGNKFVTGSEAGFDVKENMDGIDKSRIIHLGNFNGDTLQSTRNSESVLSPEDKIIWGHPGLGKTTFRQNNDNVIDFDSDIKPRVNSLANIEDGEKARNDWRKENPTEWDNIMRKLWKEAKVEAKTSGKTLIVSDMIFLKEFSGDFDKVITTSKDTFNKRSKQRGDFNSNTESWKDNIDKTISDNVNKSKLVSTDKYFSDLYNEGGITKAQILVPSKFKLGGQLVDLFEEFNGTDGVYLEKVNGVVRIKEHMIDKKLLEQFVFRIPTSSHGLGSSVEVVGFLPPESGDLIVTPKGFVAQMGQDFDIDSLTAYQYNHLVMEDGSIKELTEENRERYIQETENKINLLEQLIKEKDFNTYQKLVSSIPGVEIEDMSEKDMLVTLAEAKASLGKDFDLKLLENRFIKVHNAVYSNPAAQQQINKVLSMAFAEKQADEIESLTGETDNSFNILSPKYQMNKMNAGSTGQDAIGIYAKGVTLHSLIQQAKSLGHKIGLGTITEDGDVPKNIRIGNLSSNGVMGNMFSLKSKDPMFANFNRKISTILDERTNTGTDNEKAQILGRTGLNHTDAIAVDNLLSLLGFDAEYNKLTADQYDSSKPFHRTAIVDGKTVYYTEHSIPYMLHSQPIIKEYFAIINDKESITTDFTPRAKEEALMELIKKYADPNSPGDAGILKGRFGHWIVDGDKDIFVSTQDNRKFKADMLQNQIVLGDNADANSQLELLAMYIDLSQEAKKVKTMMQHVDLSNLGKSMWESTTKAQEFKEYFSELETTGLLGAEHLIGDISPKDGPLTEGQIDLGDNLVLTPKTNQGVMVGTALSLSEALFTNLFPAKNKYINAIIDQIFENSNINTNSSFAVIKAKEQIFQEIKRYLTSAEGLGIFNKPAKIVREQLFTDDIVNGHVSLSSYLGNAMRSESQEFNAGLKKIKNNLFLNMLKTTMGEGGKPSLITFNNQESFEANQEAIYASFKELIAEDISLPRISRNGISEYYSTRILAQELIAYSYASGGIVQGALEFHKFLPIEYLDDMTYRTKDGKDMPVSERLRRYNTFNSANGNSNLLGNFVRQYFQNNPESMTQREMKEVTLNNGDKIFTSKDPSDANFIATKVQTKSKLKQNRWRIFEKIENEKYYREIEVLGETGMAEYEFGQEELTSSLGETVAPIRSVSTLELETIQDDKLGTIPKSGSSINSFLAAIASGEYGEYQNMKEIADYLLKFMSPNEVFKYEQGNFTGRTTNGENLRINLDNISSNEDLAVTFMHEAVHIATVKEINPHLSKDVDTFGELMEGAPQELIGLNNVLQAYRKGLITQDAKAYEEFMAKWTKFRQERKENIPSTVNFTQKEIDIYYPAVNLKEFIATSLGNNKAFKETARKMPYLETGGSILRKFGSLITQLIKRIGKNEGIEENTVALQAMARSFDFIESINKPVVTEQKPVEANPQISSAEVQRLLKEQEGMPEFFEEDFQDSSQDGDPSKDVRDENSIDMIPMMKLTKNKCK